MDPTLALLGRCLGRDESEATIAELGSMLDDPGLDDLALFGLANEHELGPALGVALERKGLLARLPEEAQAYLGELVERNRERNRLIREQALRIARVLNAIGVTPVLLKGGAFLFDDAYPDPGARMLRDLDILLPEERLRDCAEALKAEGAEVGGPMRPRGHNFATIFAGDHVAPVELHRDLGRQRHIASALEAFAGARRVTEPREPAVLMPRPTVRVLHSIHHGDIQNRDYEFARVGLKPLLDLLHLERRYHAAVDWEQVRTRLGRIGESHVELAHQLLGMPRPWPANRQALRSARRRMRARAPWQKRFVRGFEFLTSPMARGKVDYLYDTKDRPVLRQLYRIHHFAIVLSGRLRAALADRRR